MPITQQRELEISKNSPRSCERLRSSRTANARNRKRQNKADAQKRKAPDQDPLGLLLLAMTVRRKGQALDVSTDAVSRDLVGFQTVGKLIKSPR